MAFKGTANKSATGASMSKYDVEVEGRLKKLEQKANDIGVIEAMVSALETKVAALESHSHDTPAASTNNEELSKKIDYLFKHLGLANW